jgi:hypothetical protein
MNRLLPLLVLLFLSCGACKKSSETKSLLASSPIQDRRIQQTYSAEPKIPACTLITTDEVGAIQGAAITDAKSSAGPSGGLMMSQCYYASTGPNLSVSLAVTQPDPRNPTAPSARKQWEQTFGRFDKKEAEIKEEEGKSEVKEGPKGAGRDEEEKARPPKKIEGVGEKAFWSGNRFGGALYVLKGDVFIRISVGGPHNEETKIEKSKRLAEKALGRLP